MFSPSSRTPPGRLPVAVVATPDEQGTAAAVDHHGGNTHRVPWALCHQRSTLAAPGRDDGCDRAGADRPPESFINGFPFTLKGFALIR
jgi:hypothetical protein